MTKLENHRGKKEWIVWNKASDRICCDGVGAWPDDPARINYRSEIPAQQLDTQWWQKFSMCLSFDVQRSTDNDLAKKLTETNNNKNWKKWPYQCDRVQLTFYAVSAVCHSRRVATNINEPIPFHLSSNLSWSTKRISIHETHSRKKTTIADLRANKWSLFDSHLFFSLNLKSYLLFCFISFRLTQSSEPVIEFFWKPTSKHIQMIRLYEIRLYGVRTIDLLSTENRICEQILNME